MTQQHLDYYTNLTETADEKFRGPEQLVWLQWLDTEHDNLMAALKRSFTDNSKVDSGSRLSIALCWYWYSVGDFNQIQYWMGKSFHESAHMGSTATKAKVLFCAGAYSSMRVRWLSPLEARAALEESLNIWHELGPAYDIEIAQSLLYLGYVQKYYFKDERGIDHIYESIETFKKLEKHWWHAWALNLLGIFFRDSDDYQSNRNLLVEANSLWNKVGDRHGQANVLLDMGVLEKDRGKFAESKKYFKKSLEMFTVFKAKGYVQRLMRHMGDVALGLKKYDDAQEYYEECIQIGRMIGQPASVSYGYHFLGYTALHMNDDKKAEGFFYQGLKIDQENKFEDNLVFCLINFAFLTTFRKKPINAARLFGAFHANIKALQREQELNLIEPIQQQEIDYYLALCQSQINKTEFEQAWDDGFSLSLDDAMSEIPKIKD